MSESPTIPGASKAKSAEEALRFEAARVLMRAARAYRAAAESIDRIAEHLASSDFGTTPGAPETPAGSAVRDALSVHRRMDALSWIESAFDSAMLADIERTNSTHTT